MSFLNKILIFLISINISITTAESNDNTILFKLNNNIFTDIDLEKRIQYIKVSNNLEEKSINDLEKKEILDDYLSSLIFYEYYIINKINYNNLNKEIDTLFKKNILNKKTIQNFNNQEIEDLKKNFIIDIIRKKIIEDFLNLRKNKLLINNNLSDLIYNYNLSYITIKEKDVNKINLEEIKNREDFNNFKKKLELNYKSFLYKSSDIKKSSIKSNIIIKAINENKKIYLDKKKGFISIISIEKNLVSYEGIFVKLINFKTKSKIENNKLDCKNIKNLIDINKTIYKEYEYKKLNEKIKNNLKSINDFMVFKENKNFNYIFLCELRYDEDILKNININKNVNKLANKLQNNFLKKYKNEYNYQKIK